jgi:D-alanyl-D-alanine carboxypeptidase
MLNMMNRGSRMAAGRKREKGIGLGVFKSSGKMFVGRAVRQGARVSAATMSALSPSLISTMRQMSSR